MLPYESSIKAPFQNFFHDFGVDHSAGKLPTHVGTSRLSRRRAVRFFRAPFVIPLSCPCRGRSAAVKRNFSHQQPMENAS